MKRLFLLLFIFLFIITIATKVSDIYADDINCSDISTVPDSQLGACVDKLSQIKNQSEKATKPLEDQIAAIQARVNFIER